MAVSTRERLDETARSDKVREALAWLERRGSKRIREEMLTRYGITAPKAFGMQVSAIQQLAKRMGHDHDLAAALWQTGWYEARMLAAYVDEPARVTSAQMDRWARDFDNWGICDTVCFVLFDRTPHAWRKVEQWSRRRDEFVKRAAFALLASIALHDKRTGDEPFLRSLALVERAAADERNFVKKGVSWALRAVGRRNRALNVAAVEVARRLSESSEAAARWVGKEALRELTSPAVRKRLAGRGGGSGG
jgi:3-methyladenine DNA glycosylase AlkD